MEGVEGESRFLITAAPVPVEEVRERQNNQGEAEEQQPEAEHLPPESCSSAPQPHDEERRGEGDTKLARCCLDFPIFALLLNFEVTFQQSDEALRVLSKQQKNK